MLNKNYGCFYGYTLVELLTSLTIVAFLGVCIHGGYRYVHRSNSIATAEQTIISLINYARFLSMSSGETLLMTGIENSWNNGIWICRYRADHQCEEKKNLIMEHRWLDPTIHIDWCGFQSSKHILFKANPYEMALNGYFNLSVDQTRSRLIVNRLGRIHKQ